MSETIHYTLKQSATILDKSHETIRAWAMEFEAFLEPLANPGKGRNRFFSPDDMAVLSLVSAMKAQGFNFPEIHTALKRGERGVIPDLKPDEAQSLISSESDKHLAEQVQTLQYQLRMAYEERDRLQAQASMALELQFKVAKLETEISMLRERLGEEKTLLRKVGELEAEVRYLREQLGKS